MFSINILKAPYVLLLLKFCNVCTVVPTHAQTFHSPKMQESSGQVLDLQRCHCTFLKVLSI